MVESCPETETVAVEYFLDVSTTTVSGVQVWGPFGSRSDANAVAVALGTRSDVTKITVRKEIA